MRRVPLALLLLLAACSSGSRTTTLGSPGPQPPTTPAATPAPSSPAAQPSPTPAPTPSPSLSPVPRRTVAAVSSPLPGRATPSPSPSPSPKRSTATFGVDEVTGDRFSPSTLTLRAGDEVLVTDRDPLAPHNFTVRALGVRSGDMAQGDTFRYRFTAPGSYAFVCTIHEGAGMTGTLTVTR